MERPETGRDRQPANPLSKTPETASYERSLDRPPGVGEPLWPLDELHVATRPDPVPFIPEPADGLLDRRIHWQPVEAPGRWRSFSACSIDVLSQEAGATAVAERQLEALAYVLALPEQLDWAVQLRIVARPAEGAQSLSIHLVLAASGSSPERAAAHVRVVAEALEVATGFLAPHYVITPIDDDGKLQEVLFPFPVGDCVEVGRQQETYATVHGSLAVPLPLPGGGGAGHLLCRALQIQATRLQAPLMWTVTLTGAPDQAIARQLVHNALACVQIEIQQLIESRSPMVLVDRVREVREAGRALRGQYLRLMGQVGRVQAFLAGSRALPLPVIAAAVAEVSGSGNTGDNGPAAPAIWSRAGRPTEQRVGQRAIDSLRCLIWEQPRPRSNEPPDCLDAGILVHLADTSQIGSLFRLPLPGFSGPFGGNKHSTVDRSGWHILLP